MENKMQDADYTQRSLDNAIKEKIKETHLNGRLTDDQRDYILEELVILEGCIARGLSFNAQHIVRTQDYINELLFIVYPGEEEAAFVEGKKQLRKFIYQEKPFIYDVQWLEISINEDSEFVDKNGSYKIDEDASLPHRAYISDSQLTQELLQAKTKNLLFLISIEKVYHEGEFLIATMNLFNNIIRCNKEIIDELINQQNKKVLSEQEKTLLDIARGEWNITVLMGDTLQAYNIEAEGEQKKAIIAYYKELGIKWRKFAIPLFNELIKTAGKKINISINFMHWDEALAFAKQKDTTLRYPGQKYDYQQQYDYLLNIYNNPQASPECAAFRGAVIAKSNAHQERLLKKNNLSVHQLDDQQVGKKNKQADKERWGEKDKKPDIKANAERVSRLIGYSNSVKDSNINYRVRQKNIAQLILQGLQQDLVNKKLSFHNNKYNFPFIDETSAIIRHGLVRSLNHYFCEAPSFDKRMITICYGTGGVGKSHLAIFYAEHSELAYTKFIRLNGSDEKKLKFDLMHFAKELNLCAKDTPMNVALIFLKKWFEKKENSGWIILVEDINNFSEIESWLPVKGGHIIATTRNKYLVQNNHINILEVDVMNDAEAIKMLQQISRRENENTEQLKLLANKLSNHPLALVMAGGFLLSNPLVTIEDYLNQYEDKFSDLMGNKKLITGNLTNQAIAVTFEVTIRQIYGDDEKKQRIFLAEELLRVLACMDSQNIPVVIIEDWLDCYHEKAISLENNLLTRLLQQLECHSLIKYDSQNDFISVHGILHDAVNYKVKKGVGWRSKSGEMTQGSADKKSFIAPNEHARFDYILIAMRILLNLFPFERKSVDDCDLKRKLLPHIEHVLALFKNCKEFTLLNSEAINILLVKIEKELILRAMVFLADIYNDIGDFAREVDLLNQALYLVLKHYGQNNLLTAAISFNLGRSYNILGDYKQAQYFIEWAYTIRNNYYGENHKKTQSAEYGQKVVRYNSGDLSQLKLITPLPIKLFMNSYSNELPIFQAQWGRSVKLFKAIDGHLMEDYDDRYSMTTLREAISFVEKNIIHIRQQDKVTNTTALAFMLLELSKYYYLTKDYLPSKESSEWALQLLIQKYGSNHIYVAFALYNLALAEGKTSGLHKKKDVLETSLNICYLTYDKNPVYYAVVLYRLSSVNFKLKNIDICIEQLRKVVSILSSIYKEYTQIIDNVLNRLVKAYYEKENHLDLKELLIIIANGRHFLYGVADPRLHLILYPLAKTYEYLGEFEKSKIIMVRYCEFTVLFNTCSDTERFYNLYNLHNRYHYITEATNNIVTMRRQRIRLFNYLILGDISNVKHKIVRDYFAPADKQENQTGVTHDPVIRLVQNIEELTHEMDGVKSESFIARLLYKGIFSHITHESSDKIVKLVQESDEEDIKDEDNDYKYEGPGNPLCQII